MLYFLEDGFWLHTELVILFVISLAIVIFARYLLISTLYQYSIHKIYKNSERFLKRIQLLTKSSQVRREIRWAILSSLIFSFLGALSLLTYQNGITMIYTDIREYSLAYLLISPVIILVLYETYYYWLHRWMHLPQVFKYVHRAHHESQSPTVFTAFAFHPLEAFLQFIFFPVIALIIPVHLWMLAVIFTILSFFAVINHSGIEIYNRGLRKVIIGATHHDVHHRQFRKNFGLNFTWWDKIMKTEGMPSTEERLAKKRDD